MQRAFDSWWMESPLPIIIIIQPPWTMLGEETSHQRGCWKWPRPGRPWGHHRNEIATPEGKALKAANMAGSKSSTLGWQWKAEEWKVCWLAEGRKMEEWAACPEGLRPGNQGCDWHTELQKNPKCQRKIYLIRNHLKEWIVALNPEHETQKQRKKIKNTNTPSCSKNRSNVTHWREKHSCVFLVLLLFCKFYWPN